MGWAATVSLASRDLSGSCQTGLYACAGVFSEWGVFDFAGGIVVPITAGVAALVWCLVLGPREGYPRTAMPPHNLTMTFMGTAMLWVGWFGFNGGGALAADGNATMAVVVTHVSAYVLIKFTGLIVPIRVDTQDELEGLDLALHEESGYNF